MPTICKNYMWYAGSILISNPWDSRTGVTFASPFDLTLRVFILRQWEVVQSKDLLLSHILCISKFFSTPILRRLMSSWKNPKIFGRKKGWKLFGRKKSTKGLVYVTGSSRLCQIDNPHLVSGILMPHQSSDCILLRKPTPHLPVC